ncbi:MAG: LysR substrate-binding domain-containing protein, partial [Pseudomonadota bacterium]
RSGVEIIEMQLVHNDGSVRNLDLIPRLKVNDPEPLLDAVRAGACIALLPDLMTSSEVKKGTCVRVLPEWRGPMQEYCAVYPSRRGMPKRVRLFLDHLVEIGDGLPN